MRKLILAWITFLSLITNSFAQGYLPLGVKPPVWTPTTPGTPIAWYKADNDSTNVFSDTGCTVPVTTNGANVVCWKDKSGNAYNLTSVNSPTYNTTGMGGNPAICFINANTNFMRTAANGVVTGTGAAFSFLTQVQFAGNYNTQALITYAPPSSSTAGAGSINFLHETGTTTAYSATIHTPTSITSNSVTIANSTPAAFATVADGTNIFSYLNGASAGAVAANTFNLISGGCIALGAGSTTGATTCNGTGTSFGGCVSEIIIYNTALTYGNVVAGSSYLQGRW